jgi:hypothetical protein
MRTEPVEAREDQIMQIEPIGGVVRGADLTRLSAVRHAEPRRTLHRVEQIGRQATADEPPDSRATEPADQPTERDHAVGGVIRLLEAGHFRGVADVRLRTIFFDELAQRAQERTAAEAQQLAAGFTESVTAASEQAFAALAGDDEANAALADRSAAFDAAVQSAVEEAVASGSLDLAALETAIRDAFGVLVEDLRGLFASPEPSTEPAPAAAGNVERPDDSGTIAVSAATARTAVDAEATTDLSPQAVEPVAPDGPQAPADEPAPTVVSPLEPQVTQPESAFDDALAILTAAFDEALASLLGSLEQSVQLPDPSPPHGSGSAYDRFLAEYDRLRATGSLIVDASA